MSTTQAQTHSSAHRALFNALFGFGQFRLTKTRATRIWPNWPYACLSPVCTYRVPHPRAPPIDLSFCPVQPPGACKTPPAGLPHSSHLHPLNLPRLIARELRLSTMTSQVYTRVAHHFQQWVCYCPFSSLPSFHSGDPCQVISRPHRRSPTCLEKSASSNTLLRLPLLVRLSNP